MTDSAYTYDPRVIWWPAAQCYTVGHGDPPPAVYLDTPDPERPDAWTWVARLDAEPMPGVPDSRDPDRIIQAIVGDPIDATDDEIHLLTHAAAMGGWLSADYITGVPQTQWPSGDQVHSVHAEALGAAAEALLEYGLFAYVDDRDGARYVLTDAGAAKAAELRG